MSAREKDSDNGTVKKGKKRKEKKGDGRGGKRGNGQRLEERKKKKSK